MGSSASSIADNFKKNHSEELGPDGKLRVCVGGGAGFIGSHIAKELKKQVNILKSVQYIM